jgi:predicted MFS family arabinose efflux permease
MTLEGLGFAIGPVIGGYSWQLFGSKAPFYAGALLYASVAVFYLLRLRRR